MKWMGDELKALGAAIEYVDLGDQTMPDGQVLPLPPVLMGELGNDPAKKTLLVSRLNFTNTIFSYLEKFSSEN